MKAMTLGKRQKNITLASVFTVAGVLYCLISLVNHFLFKTYALDLGLYTHAMYDYVHFRIDDCSMFKDVPQRVLSDHFDLYLVLFSPLIYLFGTYTLLVVQIVAVLLGGWGVYKLIGLYTDDDWMPLFASAAFLFSFGVIQPFGFDYHSNVVTAMLLPWLLYFIKQGRYGLASLFVVLFVIGKENMSRDGLDVGLPKRQTGALAFVGLCNLFHSLLSHCQYDSDAEIRRQWRRIRPLCPFG